MIKEARETSKRAAARRFRVDAKHVWEWVVSEDKLVVHQEREDGAGIYLAPLLNLPPWGAYSDEKQVFQLINLLNARGANMVIYGIHAAAGIGFFFRCL